MPNRNPESPQEKKERLAVEGAKAMKEYIANAAAVNERTARLRAERLDAQRRANEDAAARTSKPARKKRTDQGDNAGAGSASPK